MITIELNGVPCYKGHQLFTALCHYFRMKNAGFAPVVHGDPKVMIRWQCILQDL